MKLPEKRQFVLGGDRVTIPDMCIDLRWRPSAPHPSASYAMG